MNFIEKHGYIKRNKISKHLEAAKENERIRIIKQKDKQFQDELDDIKEIHFFDLQEKDAEIIQLNREINHLKERIKNVEKVYINSVSNSKINFRVASEIMYQVKNIFEKTTDMYRSFEQIRHQAELHEIEMKQKEKQNKELLQLRNIED